MERVEGLSDWHIEVLEVSAGAWRAIATNRLGSKIERTGADLDQLLILIKADAVRVDQQIRLKRQADGSSIS
jgi:hypothetical protein